MYILKNKIDNIKIHTYLVSLLILLFIFRSSNPIFKYPFIPLYIGYLIFVLFFCKINIKYSLKSFIYNYRLIFILLFIIFLSFILSRKIFLLVFKDIINGVIVLSFFYILSVIISGKEEFLILLKSLIKLIFAFSCVISLLGLMDIFGILPYSDYFMFGKASVYPFPYDNNFGLLPVIFGLVIILFHKSKSQESDLHPVLSILLIIFFSVFIILSGSKRGFTILILIISMFTVKGLYSLFLKKFLTQRHKIMLIGLLISIFLIMVLSLLFINNVSYSSKNNFLRGIGTRDITSTKEKISSNLLRNYSYFNHNIQPNEFHDWIWSLKYDPKDPDLGWGGLGIHTTVSLLTGNNVEIVPEGSKGYLMDRTYKGVNWDGDNYSITLISKELVTDSDKVNTSIYCYVSEDFNGNSAELILLHTKRNEIHSDYDLNKKGVWQKLYIEDSCVIGIVESRFYFTKHGVSDFSSLKGYVIIAYPQFSKIVTNGDTLPYYKMQIPEKSVKLMFNYQHGNRFFSMNKQEFTAISPCLLNISIFSFKTIFTCISDNDPIREWIAKFISEDTCYFGYKSKISLPQVSNPYNDRLVRWKFAIKIFSQEYNWKQKVFGGGFSFLNWYGYYFLGEKTTSDYPHNPFLHILLYSGIIGLMIYCFFLYKVFYYYIIYYKLYPLLFVFFLIVFYFSFFSSGSPFDPAMMGFLSILPFFINSIHNKEKVDLNESANTDILDRL